MRGQELRVCVCGGVLLFFYIKKMKIKGITDKISRWFALLILCVMKLCGCLCADFKTFFLLFRLA